MIGVPFIGVERPNTVYLDRIHPIYNGLGVQVTYLPGGQPFGAIQYHDFANLCTQIMVRPVLIVGGANAADAEMQAAGVDDAVDDAVDDEGDEDIQDEDIQDVQVGEIQGGLKRKAYGGLDGTAIKRKKAGEM